MKVIRLAVVMLMCGLLSACQQEKPVPSKDLRICSINELAYSDPQKVCDSSDYKIIQSAFEGLIIPDPETLKPTPAVAERWTVSSDKKTYEFFIRDTAVWSNGKPVTAEDFVYSARRALSSKFMCPFAELFFPLKNARAFFNREIRDFSKVGITAIDSRTLRITLEEPTPHFLTILMHPCWSPLNDTVVASFKQYNQTYGGQSAAKLRIISNGPFVFSERIPGTCLLLRKNQQYWDADNVMLQSVMFLSENNQVYIEKSFAERNIDIAEVYYDNPGIIGDCSDNNELMISQSLDSFVLVFNMENPVFQNKKLRHALSLAIDRDKILDVAGKHPELCARRVIPCKKKKYAVKPLFYSNFQEAEQLLLEAGYDEKHPVPPISILCNVSESDRDSIVLEEIRKDWEKLGINVTVDYRELSVFASCRKRMLFDIAKVKLRPQYDDPTLMLNMFTSKHIKNFGKWSDISYDSRIKKIRRVDSGYTRQCLIKEAEAYLAQELPVIPLFFDSNSYLVRNRIVGWFPNAMNIHPIKFVYFSR